MTETTSPMTPSAAELLDERFPGVGLDEALLDCSIAVLGATGSGKTNAAAGLCEVAFELGHPVVVIDPMGAWPAFAYDRDGERVRDIAVFGGVHHDQRGSAADDPQVMLDTLTRHRFVVLDVSTLHEPVMHGVVTQVVDALFDLLVAGGGPLLLVLEEAETFIPQVGTGHRTTRPMSTALARYVKRARQFGGAAVLISQRAADIQKGVLGQVGTLVALRSPLEHDRRAIEMVMPAASERDRGLLDRLPFLDRGEALVSNHGRVVLTRVAPRRSPDNCAGLRSTPPSQVRPAGPVILADTTPRDGDGADPAGPDQAAVDLADHVTSVQAQVASLAERVTALEATFATADADRRPSTSPPVTPSTPSTPKLTPDGRLAAVLDALAEHGGMDLDDLAAHLDVDAEVGELVRCLLDADQRGHLRFANRFVNLPGDAR